MLSSEDSALGNKIKKVCILTRAFAYSATSVNIYMLIKYVQKKKCPKIHCKLRHPVPCKYKDKCKFIKKGDCAYSHDVTHCNLMDDGLPCEESLCNYSNYSFVYSNNVNLPLVTK